MAGERFGPSLGQVVIPPSEETVPAAVVRLAAGRVVEPVWRNQSGGLTFRLTRPGAGSGREVRYCKWAPAGVALDLAAEVPRMRWAAAFTVVPEVLAQGADGDGSWLLTRGLPGDTAVAARWRARPEVAVPALGRGLRALHEVLPVTGCPFDWSVPFRLAQAVGPTADLLDPPPVDRLVVCHGDACSPNTLLTDDGAGGARVSGHVDLASLGVADRWADLAVATLATGWNYGPGWEEPLLAAYGVAPDPVRTDYYRRLWDVGP